MIDDELEYGAISLDTSIFDKNSRNLEGGLLSQMQQFKRGHVKFVLSEIVTRELFSHMKNEASDAKIGFQDAIKAIERNHLINGMKKHELEELKDSLAPDKVAENRLEVFIKNTGCQITEAEKASINDIVESYFSPKPPFEDKKIKSMNFLMPLHYYL